MKRALLGCCLVFLAYLTAAGPAKADYAVTFDGFTATGPMNTTTSGVCALVAGHFSGSWDPRTLFPDSLQYPGSTNGNANLMVYGNIPAGSDASTWNTYTDYKGNTVSVSAVGPGCVFGGRFGTSLKTVKIWVAASLSCNTSTEDLVNGACVPKCTATQERDASGTCVAACQQPYVGGVEFLAGQSKVVRECFGAGGVTVVDGTGGSSTAPVRPYCWHYVGGKTTSGVNTGGTYYEDYSVYTQAGDVCATLGTKDCPSGSICPVVNDPNTNSNTSGGSTSTGGTSTGGTTGGGTTTTGGSTTSAGSQVAAVNYCANSSTPTNPKAMLCNADGSGRPFVAASSETAGAYSNCAVPASSGAGTLGNGYDSKACYASTYSASWHSAVCLTESNDIPIYAGPSQAGYNVTASSPDTACLASSSASAVSAGADNAGSVLDASMVGHVDAPRVLHCQYVKTAVGLDAGGGTVYRYKPLGSACLGGAATTGGTSSSGGTTTGGSSTTGTTTGGTTSGGTSSTGGTSNGGTSTGGSSTGGSSTGTGSSGSGSTDTVTSEEPVTSPGTPSVPSSFYTSSYPNGISGVVQSRTAEAKNTGIIQWLKGFGFTDGGSWEPKWTLALGKFGTHVIEIPTWIIGALRAIVLVSAILTARKIVFGG